MLRALEVQHPLFERQAQTLTRIPSGHPEGYLEAFANLYRNFAAAIRGEPVIEDGFPTVDRGVRGMRFLAAVLRSHAEGAWVDV